MTSQNNSANNDIEQTASYGQKLEPFKAMFSDLNLSNYNVAVLGVALLTHELSNFDYNHFEQAKIVDLATEPDAGKVTWKMR